MAEEEAEKMKCLIPGYESLDVFAQNAFTTIVTALKAGNGLPKNGDDFDYYSSFDGFREVCHQNGERILRIIRQMIGNQMMTNALAKSSLSLEIEEKMEALIDANDSMLEKVGSLLDEATGAKKKPALVIPASAPAAAEVSIASWNKKDKNSTPKSSFHMMYAKNTPRPQLKFAEKVDNSNIPFKPIIKHKPNALKPLQTDVQGSSQSVQEFISQQRQEVETGVPAVSAPHPYQFEIESFEPQEWQLEVDKSCQFLPVHLTPLTSITKKEELENLSQVLKKQNQFAVDLEHHSYRSFQGFTCLMQISTADHDYLIDTLELRGELHILNESFTDPKIVKVFHGATMDIEWLQRDFGIYVVNLFDTGEASRTLGLTRNSLGYLLQHYCKVEADKKYQLADWRIRPLPEEMKLYAREDTHYLLYIYNKMKEELINLGNEQKNLLKTVIGRSKLICLKKYNKPLFTSVSYLTLYKKNRKQFNAKQIHALKLLYAWRDSVAREEDESTGYVLPNHMMFQISEHLPRETSGILACCNPIPPLVMKNVAEIHRLIIQARNYQGEPEINAKKVTEPPKEEVTFPSRVINILESILHCPHDLSATDHSTLQPTESWLHQRSTKHTLQMAKPSVPILGMGIVSDVEESIKVLSKADKVAKIKASLYNPFQMYLPSKPNHTSTSEKPSQVAASLLNADKITIGDVSSPNRNVINSPYVWKMKQSPKPPVPPQLDATRSEETLSRKTENSTKVKKSSTEKEAVPLRALKRKASREDSHDAAKESNPRKRTKEELVNQIPDFSRVNQPQFQPYDYSQNQHIRFDNRYIHPEDPLPVRKKGKRYYKRVAPKSHVHPRSGQKSMSFSQSERYMYFTCSTYGQFHVLRNNYLQ